MKKRERTAGAGSKMDVVRLRPDEVEIMSRDVPHWTVGEGTMEREFSLGDFRSAIEFVNRVADLAEEEDHHPDIFISYNRVRFVHSTHKVGGLSRKDFLLASKIDRLAEEEM